jgi:hypothetical protein
VEELWGTTLEKAEQAGVSGYHCPQQPLALLTGLLCNADPQSRLARFELIADCRL